MSAVIGVWAGAGSSLLTEVQPGMPLLRLTLRRAKAAALPLYVLIPWTNEHDHLEEEISLWGFQTRRTHTDERIAMRDLVAECRVIVKGVLVRGEAAAVEAAEIALACARLENGWEEYVSPRITAYSAQRWLKVSDSDEWPAVMGVEEAKRFYRGGKLEGSARAIAARALEAHQRND